VSAVQPASATTAAADWFGQPRGLTILFLTEAAEKFSYYGMRAILIYYMTKGLLIEQQRASLVYGIYTAFVYFTPLLGGIAADRWLGRRRSVVLGGAIMAAGHFMLAVDGLFYPGLATIALGNGLYLPSLPSQIANLYDARDPRRPGAYNIYYAGINLGSFLAPLVCGTLGELWGWHWGFAAAGTAMVLGLATYVAGSRYLPAEARYGAESRRRIEPAAGLARRFMLLAGITGAVVVFRGAYEQTGNTVALWADTGVDRVIGSGFTVPMTSFQALNPLLILVLTPAVVAYWGARGRQGRNTSSIVRMATGAATVALSYALLAYAAASVDAKTGGASPLWLVGHLMVLTLGELYILPVGLGLFGRLAPQGLTATTIAAWYSALFFGNLFAGFIGSFWSRLPHAPFFLIVAGVSAASGLLLLMFDAPVRRAEQTVPTASTAEIST
jgi:proton-dependent oligopeptide transporter, POT family